jgi:hypothetical protein
MLQSIAIGTLRRREFGRDADEPGEPFDRRTHPHRLSALRPKSKKNPASAECLSANIPKAQQLLACPEHGSRSPNRAFAG